jgi:phospholipase C
MNDHITRREVLKGLMAAAAAALATACRGLPGPAPYTSGRPEAVDTRWPIKRVIYLMMENRSFDHVFGRFPGVNGTTVGVRDGREVPLIPVPQWLPGDLLHSWQTTLEHVNGGAMDGFGRDEPVAETFAYSQGGEEDFPNYWHWAREFVLSDNFFASTIGNSFPQHLYMIAGHSGGTYDSPRFDAAGRRELESRGLAKTWGCDAPESGNVPVAQPGMPPQETDPLIRPCLDLDTQGRQLTRSGIDWAYYTALPHQHGYVWNAYTAISDVFHDVEEWARRIRPVDNVVRDIRDGNIPAVTWITPLFQLSDHPPWSICFSHDWVTTIVNAVMTGPMWRHTAIFITWDEWGGFYDHVEPPKVDHLGLGIRVPCLTISPYAARGLVDHELGEFVSPHRFIADNWGLGYLSDRVRGTHNFEHVFEFERRPRDPVPRPFRGVCRGEWQRALWDAENWPAPFGDLDL